MFPISEKSRAERRQHACIAAAFIGLASFLQACASTPDDARDESRSASGTAAVEEHVGDTQRVESRASAEPRTKAEAQAAFDARKTAFFRVNSQRDSENGGTVVVTFTVTPGGEVVECRIVSTDFRDLAFNAAVVAEVWRLRLERRDVPEFTYPAYPIVFSSRAEQQAALAAAPAAAADAVAPLAAVPSTAPAAVAAAARPPATVTAVPPPAPPPPDPSAPRTTAEVQQAFHASMDAFKRIQQRYGPALRGTIVTAFTIAPGGEIQEVRIVSSDFEDAALHAEVQAEISRVRLGRIADKPYTYRDYPIVFVPAADSP